MRMVLPSNRPGFFKRSRFARPGWLRNDEGVAAIEFAIVALPFFLFVFGIIGFGLYFLASTSLEYGAQAAARKVRTGEADKGDMTVGEFKQLVCDAAGTYIKCGNVAVLVQHAAAWSGVTPQSCTDSNGAIVSSTGQSGELISKYAGGASEVVLVTLCYRWELADKLKFLKMGSGPGGSGPAIIQASAAFKTEPWE
ncbi:MAG TPA: TadE/TadG family type IV pilus assembly protein [Pseudolabrys sp.]